MVLMTYNPKGRKNCSFGINLKVSLTRTVGEIDIQLNDGVFQNLFFPSVIN